MGRVYIQLRNDVVGKELDSKIMVANRLLLEDIYDRSLYNTPLGKTSNLRGFVSRRVEDRIGIIEWKVPYASYQERGMRADGTRKVRHYTTPGTGPHFARNAVREALVDIERLYKGLI